MEAIQYKTPQAVMLYKAIIYVLKHENIPYDEKFETLLDQIINYSEESDAVHLADLLDGLHDFIKKTTDYDDYDREDEDDEIEEEVEWAKQIQQESKKQWQ